MILVWVLGAPMLGFMILTCNRNKLDNPKFFSLYRMIYQGLKPHLYYWEFVNILRKTLLVATNVFFNTFDDIFKTIFSLFFLVAFFRIKEKIQPYKNPLLNHIEGKEHLTSILTFFGALFFVNTEFSDAV